MADKKSFVGARLRVTTSEGEYEGTVHSIDAEKRKLSLSKGEKSRENEFSLGEIYDIFERNDTTRASRREIKCAVIA